MTMETPQKACNFVDGTFIEWGSLYNPWGNPHINGIFMEYEWKNDGTMLIRP